MSTQVSSSYTGTPGLGTGVFVQWRDPVDGSILVARSNSGIREDVAGCYISSKSLTDKVEYEALWDEGDGIFFVKLVVPQRLATTETTVLAASAPASINPLVFTIKRGDTDPSIIVQALYPDPLDGTSLIAWPIPGGSTAKFTMRDSADFSSRTRTAFTVTTPKVHATASIDDNTNGIMSYGWAVGDTDTDGLFRAEFEVTSGSEIRTFPVGADDTRNWIAVSIVDDLDPGITP